jgi:hypothetical protein
LIDQPTGNEPSEIVGIQEWRNDSESGERITPARLKSQIFTSNSQLEVGSDIIQIFMPDIKILEAIDALL